MPEKEEYTRLARARARSIFAVAFTSRSSLWLAADHLLCVDSTGYAETYKRFYFRDIQAILLVTTDRKSNWNWALSILLSFSLLLLVVALLMGPNVAAAIICGTFSLLFAVPLVINNISGPTCLCQLQTAVQLEELCPLRRIRRARKVFARLRPLIVAAQGEMPVEEIVSRMQAAAVSSEGLTKAALHPAVPAPPPENPPIPPIIS